MTDEAEEEPTDDGQPIEDSLSGTESDNESPDIQEDVERLTENTQQEGEIATAVTDSVQQCALQELLRKYEPDEFNHLVNMLTNEYEGSHKRNIRYKFGIMTLTVILILGLFAGLAWFVLNSPLSGESLVFFAGTLVGYFARVATELM